MAKRPPEENVSTASWLIRQARVVLPDRITDPCDVLVQQGRIAAIGPRGKGRLQGDPKELRRVDLQGDYLAPGMVDLHVHGGQGSDFMDGTLDAFRIACTAHLQHGTTTIVPTSTTASPDQIDRFLSAAGQYRDGWDRSWGAWMPGVHLYGPFFAAGKTGCHAPEEARAPEAREYLKYLRSGLVLVATSAAELPGAVGFYRAAVRAGCLVTCGHSNATWGEMAAGWRAGMRHVDHFWCAMSSIPSLRARCGVPMQASMAEFVLAEATMSTEVIADGCHLSPELLQFARRMIGPDRLCLVTDSNRAMDMPPGRYRFGNAETGPWFESDGKVGWASPGSLASSVQGMDHMVRGMVRQGKATLFEAFRMASLTPARLIGLDDQMGSLEPGKRADLLVLSKTMKLKSVMLQGEWVHGSIARGSIARPTPTVQRQR
ncbi:MAG: N-acetylglucosamine-6-phosphate deacetylase [Pirellulaceae bacterium]